MNITTGSLYILLLFFLVNISGCGKGNGQITAGADSSPLVEISSIPLINTHALAGSGNIVAVDYTDSTGGNYPEKLNLYQQDSANPDYLLFLSSVYLGEDTLYKRTSYLNVNSEWASIHCCPTNAAPVLILAEAMCICPA